MRIIYRTAEVAAAIICLYYFVYLMLCVTGFDARIMSLFALAVMTCAALPVIFRVRLRRLFGRAFNALYTVFAVLLCVYVITVVIFWAYIGFAGAKSPSDYSAQYASQNDSGADTVVLVFGCRIYGERPSLTLRLRLDAAAELLHALPEAACIVSGGQGMDEPVTEALVMKNYLIFKGISASRIIMEDRSHSTSENVRFSGELLKSLGLSQKRIIGISTAFHLPRIEFTARRYELPMETCASPSPSLGHHYVSMVREYLSYIKMIFFDRAVLITKVT